MSMVRQEVELDYPSEPQPEHNRKDYDALRCNGSGLVG